MPESTSIAGLASAASGTPGGHGPLIAALEGPSNDIDTPLEQAVARLAAGGDLQLLLAAVKAMVRAGIAGLAVRLLRSRGGLLAEHADLRTLVDQLADLPSGETHLASLSDRYRANRRALLAARPHLKRILESDEAVSDKMHLFITQRGNVQIVRDDPAGGFSFVFPFADHRRQAGAIDLGETSEGSSLLLIGVPVVPLFERLLSLRSASGYRPPIDIIEPDASILRFWLHLIQTPEVFVDERIGIFAGTEALEQYEEHRVRALWRQEPTHVLTNHRPAWKSPKVDLAFRQRVRASVDHRRELLLKQQDALYRDCTVDSWARRFRRAGFNEPPLRVLGFTTRFSTVIQHVMRDIAGAFERRGCTFDLVKEPDAFSSDVDTYSTLAERPYDLVFVINHLRRELADRIHRNLPYVCWIQDHMTQLTTPQAGRSVGPLDLVLGRGVGMMNALYDYPPQRFIVTSNLTDLITYSNEPVAPADIEHYRCDLSYVSHGSATPDQLVDELGAALGPPFEKYFRRLLELLRTCLEERGWVPFMDKLAFMLQAEEECGGLSMTPSERFTNIYPELLRLFDRLIRHQALSWAATWADKRSCVLRIFGRGWEKHPTLSQYACGEIRNGYPLRCLYQASNISLQINGYSSLHQRFLDGIASGGFVLTRYNPKDFLLGPMIRLHKLIEQNNITTLEHLLRFAEESPAVAAQLDELKHLDQPIVALSTDPCRRRDVRLMRECCGFAEEKVSDEAHFESFASCRYLPTRLAGDIPGFDQTTFDSMQSLNSLLDRLVIDPEARNVISARMREDIKAHDTYDALVDRIITAFQDSRAIEEAR